MVDGDPGLKTALYGSPGGSTSDPGSGTPGSSLPPSSLASRARTEVMTRLAEELARFGAVGGVRITGSEVVLDHPSGPRRAIVDDWLLHWDLLDEPTRRIRVSQLARSLARPTSLPVSRPPVARAPNLWPWLLLGLLVAAMAIGAVWTVGDLGRGPGARRVTSGGKTLAATPAAAAVGASDPSRAALVCAATRARVVRGATVTIADAEGWVVEYMAFRPSTGSPTELPLEKSTALSTFFEAPNRPEGTRYIWPEEPSLAAVPTSEDRVVVRPESITGASAATHAGVRITFEGALVDAYFRSSTRGAYFHLASALSDTLGASHAALYARCADGDTHHLGSWFRGRDHQDAVVALIYSLGTFAEPPHLADPYLRPLGQTAIDKQLAFSSIARVASALDRPLVASLIGREGGMVMGRPGEVVTLTFPFEDGNRASRLSREVARLTRIGGM